VAEIPETFNMLCDYPGGPTVVLVSSMANDTAIEHVIRGHKATVQFNREGFVITPQETSDEGPKVDEKTARELRLLIYKKAGAEDVKLHHQNLHAAIRKGDNLRCDVELGYRGVVVTMMGVESFRTQSYLKWNREKEKVEKA
jgi:hypothetical protein